MPRSNLISGIDIGSSKISTVVAQHFPEEERINIIGVASTPAKGIRKGQIVNIEEATESLTESVEAAERMAGYAINQALVSLNAPHITSLNSSGVVAVSDPRGEINQDDVERVIEAARAISLPSSVEIIHVIPRQFTVDGQEGVVQPVGMTGVRLEAQAHIITASAPAIKNLDKCLDEVGIKASALVYSGLATAEAVLSETEKELGVILIDVGGATTSLTIFIEGSPCHSVILPIGAINVTNDLAIGLRVSLEDAEQVKLKLSAEKEKSLKKGKKEDPDDEVFLKDLGIVNYENRKISQKTAIEGIIKPRLEEIFSLIREEIRNSGFGGMTPAGLVITGGGALTVGVKESSQKILSLPVRIGYPREMGGLVEDVLTPTYASCLGLVLYSLKIKEFSGREGGKLFDLKDFGKKIHFRGFANKIAGLIKPLLP